MAYVTPNGQIILCRGVPLDKSYNHTMYWSNYAGQAQIIGSFAKPNCTFNNTSYQRVNKNTLRIATLADNIYDCNYMMFRNKVDGTGNPYSTKYFYAFIDEVKYINDNCTEVVYTIDVMQSWFFDYTLGHCFVEREHTLTDNFGDNLVPEDIPVGKMVVNDSWDVILNDDTLRESQHLFYFVVFYSANNKYINIQENTETLIRGHSTWTIVATDIPAPTSSYKGFIHNLVYHGSFVAALPIYTFDTSYSQERINFLLNTITSNSGTVLKCVQIPSKLWEDFLDTSYSITSSRACETKCYAPNDATYYTPHNNKLNTYPYKELVVSNMSGNTTKFKWEDFNDGSATASAGHCTFDILGVAVPSPEIECVPASHNKQVRDWENAIVLSQFVQNCWNVDSFNSWYAQNDEFIAYNLMTSAIQSIASLMSSGVSSLAIGGNTASLGTTIKDVVGEGIKAYDKPDAVNGNLNSLSLRSYYNRIGIHFESYSVSKEDAKIIDNYFDMFGYAIKQVKIPNVKDPSVGIAQLRPTWNYIKTNGCIVHAIENAQHVVSNCVPAGVEDEISKIYDRGITFWTNIYNIGNYSLDNYPR